MDVKILKYHGVEVPFFKVSGTWLIPVKSFGAAIGYHGKGQKLVASVLRWQKSGLLSPVVNPDMPHNGDVILAEGDYLESVKASLRAHARPGLMPEMVTTPSMLLIGLQGLSKVISKANVKGVRELRDQWERVTTSLMDEKSPMPEFTSAQLELKGTKKVRDVTIDIDPLVKVKKAIQLAKDLEELGAISLTVAKDIAHKAMNNAVSEMWPEAVVPYQDHRPEPQAMTVDSLAPALGLRAGQELPAKWKGFSTAAELGKVFGKSSESVGHHIPSILEEQYGEGVEMRANKIADRLGTALDPVKFRNSVDPETGLATVYSEGGHCIALYGQNAAGGFNWRNYWSPQLSNILIVKLAERYKMSLPPQQPNGQKAMPAPIPFTAIQKIPDKA